MNRFILLLGAVVFMFSAASSRLAMAHDDDPRVSIEREANVDVQAGTVTVEFELVDMKDKTVLKEADLSVLHEKKLHAFFFDPALKEFRHEHPEFIDSKWRVNTIIPVNGNYWFWAQGKIASDGEEFTASTRLKVVGGAPANPLPPVLGEARAGIDGLSKVTLSNGKLVAKQMAMLMLRLSRTDGSVPKLSPYLGELAHVVGVLEDGDSLLHIHPISSGNPNELMLHTEFPAAGQYRLWVQFIDDGILKTVPLSVVVNTAE